MMIDSTASRLSSQGVAYAQQIAGAARRHGLDPELLAAVAAQETGGPGSNSGHNVVGDGGHGRGLFQIDDRWHAFAESPAAMDPGENADYAAGMISGLLSRYGGNVHRALSAYNAGNPDATGTLTQWPGGRTLGYADSVMQHYAKLTGTPAEPAGLAATGQVLAGGDPPHETGVSEIGTLLAELSAMQAQSQAMPSLPSAPASPQPQPYQPQVTDYGSLLAGNDDN
jgi:hypothetical protein